MLKVKAKVLCQSVKHDTWGHEPTLNPVYGDSDENKTYNTATPSGEFKLRCSNDSAAGKEGFFEPGAEYYVTFEKIVKEKV